MNKHLSDNPLLYVMLMQDYENFKEARALIEKFKREHTSSRKLLIESTPHDLESYFHDK